MTAREAPAASRTTRPASVTLASRRLSRRFSKFAGTKLAQGSKRGAKLSKTVGSKITAKPLIKPDLT